MSFNTYYIQDPDILVKNIKEFGPSNIIRNANALVGNHDSILIYEYIDLHVNLNMDDSLILSLLAKEFPIYFND